MNAALELVQSIFGMKILTPSIKLELTPRELFWIYEHYLELEALGIASNNEFDTAMLPFIEDRLALLRPLLAETGFELDEDTPVM